MSSVVNILRKMTDFDKAEKLDGYSKVTIIVSDDIEYSAGTDTGRTLTLSCPWGTQEVANNILAQIRGFQYQPMTVGGGLIDPAAEIGDGISANNVYSGIFSQDITYNSNLPQDVTAPADEELYEEHKYVPKTEREVTRKFADFKAQFVIQDQKISLESEERKSDIKTVKATLSVQADQITAKVNKNDGHSSTFGWALETDSWRIFSGNTTVLKATKSGLEIKGTITATGGKIGGFDIQSNYLSYNGQTWGGTNTWGAYLGTSGLQLGKNFKVDMAGNLTAASGTFTGSVHAGNIQYGDSAGYLSGNGLSGGSVSGAKIAGSTLSTAKFTSGVNASLANADYAYGCLQGWTKITALTTGSLNTNDLTVENHQIDRKTIYYTNSSGGTSSVKVLVWT